MCCYIWRAWALRPQLLQPVPPRVVSRGPCLQNSTVAPGQTQCLTSGSGTAPCWCANAFKHHTVFGAEHSSNGSGLERVIAPSQLKHADHIAAHLDMQGPDSAAPVTCAGWVLAFWRLCVAQTAPGQRTLARLCLHGSA